MQTKDVLDSTALLSVTFISSSGISARNTSQCQQKLWRRPFAVFFTVPRLHGGWGDNGATHGENAKIFRYQKLPSSCSAAASSLHVSSCDVDVFAQIVWSTIVWSSRSTLAANVQLSRSATHDPDSWQDHANINKQNKRDKSSILVFDSVIFLELLTFG